MTKKWIALAMAALLVLAMAGCGEDKNNTNRPNSDSNGANNSTNNNTTNNGTDSGTDNGGNDAANNGTGSGGTPDDGVTDSNGMERSGRSSYGTYRDRGNDKAFTENRGSTFGQTGREIQEDAEQWPPTVYDSMTGAHGTATWRQMLDNGFVRDTDGFLLDGENACWS